MATKSTPDSVDLKLSNYNTTAAMNGSIASANNATLATVARPQDGGVANALLGVVTAAALASKLAS